MDLLSFQVLGGAIVFGLHLLVAGILCGAGMEATLDAGRSRFREPEEALPVRRRLALFLCGTAFGPLLIGVLQALWLFVLPELPRSVYLAAHWAVLGALTWLLRRRLVRLLRQLLELCFGERLHTLGTIAVIAATTAVSFLAVDRALQPQAHYDAESYALDARRLAQERRLGALMSEEPDGRHQLSYGQHGKGYQTFLSTALLYSPAVREDFPVRLASRLLYAQLVVAVAGVALDFSAAAGVLAPLVFVTAYSVLPWLVNAASRDAFRLLALLVAVPSATVFATRRTAATGVALFAALAFLWHAHGSSILVVPTFALAALVLIRDWRCLWQAGAILVAAAIAGGWRTLWSTVRDGKPGFTMNPNWEGTGLYQLYMQNRVDRAGAIDLLDKLHACWTTDGRLLVPLIGCAVVAVFLTILYQRRVKDPRLAFVALFVLICQLQLAGAFDLVHGEVSRALAVNYRYRSHIALIGCIVAAAVVPQYVLSRLPRRGPQAGVLLLGAAALLAMGRQFTERWQPNPEKYCLTWSEFQQGVRARPASGYLAFYDSVRENGRIISTEDYRVWYHCAGADALSPSDPRTWDLWHADSPTAAIAELDKLDIEYVHVQPRTIKLLKKAGHPLADGLKYAFTRLEGVGRHGHDAVYKRTADYATREKVVR